MRGVWSAALWWSHINGSSGQQPPLVESDGCAGGPEHGRRPAVHGRTSVPPMDPTPGGCGTVPPGKENGGKHNKYRKILLINILFDTKLHFHLCIQ